MALVLFNFYPLVHAQTLVESSPTNNALVAQPLSSSAVVANQGVTAPAPPHKKFTYSISNYAEGRSDLTPDQIKIGFALTTIDLATRNKNRAATLALIRKTYDDVNFPIFKNSVSTPLVSAASWGEVEIATAILAKGVAVDSVRSRSSQEEVSVLISTVSATAQAYQANPMFPPAERFLETIKLLLKAGANPNATCCNGQTPLSTALALRPHDPAGEKTKVAIIKALLDSSADPGTLMPPLKGVNSENAAEISALLLEHGPDPKAKNSNALAAAVHNRKLDLVKLLLGKSADPNVFALYGDANGKMTVLTEALMMGEADIAIALMIAGANPNACGDGVANVKCTGNGMPLLFMALREPELIHLMIAKGTNPNTVYAQDQTALGYAISYQKQNISLLCVAGTTNCMKPPEDKLDRTAAVKMLLDSGADPNQRSGSQLPLMMADDGDHEIITLLLDKGARLESISVEGEQIGPISQVTASHKYFLANELLRRTKGKLLADEKWALYSAAVRGEAELAEALIQHGINLDERGPLGETALHYAAHNGNAAMVKRLLMLGANPNVQTDTMPPLTPEAKMKIYATVRQFPPNIGDGKVTPLMLAVVSGDVEVAKALLDGGAKASLKSQQGLSALDIAHRMGNQEMERLLAGR